MSFPADQIAPNPAVHDPYDAFAEDYHWIFPAEHVSGRRFVEEFGELLGQRLVAGAEVLDCACGVGIESLALARAGYRVTASDASAGMVERTRLALDGAGYPVRVARCSWEALPERFTATFDAILCLGNSIAHAAGGEAMVRSLAGMAAVLRPGGLLVLESRDWEALRSERPRIEVRGPSSVRGGERGHCLYVWTIPERWEEPHVAEIVVVVERAGEVRHRTVELRFLPYRRDELLERLVRAGLEPDRVTTPRPGRYVVTAHSREL